VRPKVLALVSAGFLLLGPVVLVATARLGLDYDSYHVTLATLVTDPVGLLTQLLLTGYYPIAVYPAYLCAGMAIGRLDLRSPRVAWRLLGAGIGLAVTAQLVSFVLLHPLGGLRHLLAEEYDLRLMSSVSDVDGIPTAGEDLIVVAVVDHGLHFRIFDDDGDVVADGDEKRLAEQAQQIDDLRKQLESLWPPHELTESERVRVVTAVTSIVGHSLESPESEAELLWDPDQGTSWWYLAVPAPHSHTTIDVAHTLGSAMAVLGAALLLTGVAAIRRPLRAVADVGTMTLTLYSAHVFLRLLPADVREDWPLALYLLAVIAALLFAVVWRRWIGQGPLEGPVARAATWARRSLLRATSAPTAREM